MSSLIKDYASEMREAVFPLELDMFKEFFVKWGILFGLFNMFSIPTDDIIEITMYKLACNMPDAPAPVKEAAEVWLKDHNYSSDLGGMFI